MPLKFEKSGRIRTFLISYHSVSHGNYTFSSSQSWLPSSGKFAISSFQFLTVNSSSLRSDFLPYSLSKNLIRMFELFVFNYLIIKMPGQEKVTENCAVKKAIKINKKDVIS